MLKTKNYNSVCLPWKLQQNWANWWWNCATLSDCSLATSLSRPPKVRNLPINVFQQKDLLVSRVPYDTKQFPAVLNTFFIIYWTAIKRQSEISQICLPGSLNPCWRWKTEVVPVLESMVVWAGRLSRQPPVVRFHDGRGEEWGGWRMGEGESVNCSPASNLLLSPLADTPKGKLGRV